MDPSPAMTSAPESRVLIIMTGGTICMKQSPDGLIPSRGFLEAGMEPRPSFNDGSKPIHINVVTDDGLGEPYRSLRCPISRYHKHVRYAVYEFEELLDSSSINGAFPGSIFSKYFGLTHKVKSRPSWTRKRFYILKF